MNKMMVAASAVAMLAASSVAAFADEINGAIASIDPAAGTVTLDDGSTYVLSSPESVATLQVGDQVTITYDEASDGQRMASDVMPQS